MKPQWPCPHCSPHHCLCAPFRPPPIPLHSRGYYKYLSVCLNPPSSGGPPLVEVLLDSGYSLESSLAMFKKIQKFRLQTRPIGSGFPGYRPAHLYFSLLCTGDVDLQSGRRSTHCAWFLFIAPMPGTMCSTQQVLRSCLWTE